MKIKKICVLGLGYIGLPTASTFATHGLKVLGVDVNSGVVDSLSKGKLHIHEPGLDHIVNAAITTGNLTVSSRPQEADVFLIAVPTPFHEDQFGEYEGRKYRLADMSAVISATEAIVPYLRKGNLVILESTSPPRTTVDLIAPILERSNLKAGSDFFLCYSPERVLPGRILHELIENARVVGGITPESAQAGRELYATFVRGEIIETDATTAEMVKLMENTTRDVNIAIANEFSRLAEKFGVDVWEAIRLANLHPRINILSPGPGVGGHCISVDPWFLVEAAPEISSLIQAARTVNDAQPQFVLEKARQALGDLDGKKVAALGLAYKPNVDDLRESPAVDVVHLLQEAGVTVKAWEPHNPNAKLKDIDIVSSLEETVKDSEGILILVKHSEFLDIDPDQLLELTPARIVIDTVNAWDKTTWEEAGFKIFKQGAG